MDPGSRWRGLPREPSLKHLTDPSYGVPPEQQKPALQELTQAHVESFNYAVREGLGHAVQVSAAPQEPSQLRARWRRWGRRRKGALRGRRRAWGVGGEAEGETQEAGDRAPESWLRGHSIIPNGCAP